MPAAILAAVGAGRNRRSRAPDAAQRGALAAWCAAKPGPMPPSHEDVGPGSAVHREERCTASGTRCHPTKKPPKGLSELMSVANRSMRVGPDLFLGEIQ